MQSTERERTLARALKAALKWPYDITMLDHVKGEQPAGAYDPAYVADVYDMRAGARAAEEIGEPVFAVR